MKKLKFIILFSLLLNSAFASSVISGYVSNKADGEPVHYANIFLENTRLGAVSNADGYYVLLNVPKGTYTIAASVIGYSLEKHLITVGENSRINIHFDLVQEDVALDEVVVTAEREKFKQDIKISSVTMNQTSLRTVPVLIEADLFRALQMLPSVTTGNDFSSALYVRGGSPDQNLILLDGITVYNPYHFGGIFSTFNTDAVKEAEFMAGGFPAEYGGRMSSVLDIKNREGNSEEFHGSGNVSILSTKLLLEGPLPRGSFMISGRRTYFDAIWEGIRQGAKIFNNGEDLIGFSFPYYFYDLQWKANFDITDKHRTTISGFYGNDVLWFKQEFKDGEYGRPDYSLDQYSLNWTWGNNTTSFKHRWLIRPDLIAKFFVAHSRFNFDVDMLLLNEHYDDDDSTVVSNSQNLDIYDYIDDWSQGIDMTWLPNTKHTVQFGGFHKNIDFSLGSTFNETVLLDSLNYSNEWGFYVQDKYKPSPLFIFQPGFRLTRYKTKGKFYPDYRFKAKYLITDKLAYSMAYGTVHQFLQTVNFENELIRFIDIWFPTQEDQEVSKATHYNAGLEYWYDNIQFTVEGYYKDYDHLLTMDEDFSGANLISFIEADGYAYGLELLAKKTSGDLTGWIGYTFARSMKRESEAAGYYPPKYDKTHNLNVVAQYDIDKRWYFNTSLVWTSGNPYTLPYGNFHFNDVQNPIPSWLQSMSIYGERNSVRYPNYFRWDMGVNRRAKLFKQDVVYYFHVMNITNHKNVFLYLYEDRDSEFDPETNTSVIYRQAVTMFPILPTFGVEFKF